MRKVILPLLLLLFIVPQLYAQGPKIGFGAFGGMNIPVVQDDQGSGTAFGVRARIKLMPVVVFEPNIMFGQWGDPGAIDGFELGISGSKVNSYGVDVTLGSSPGGKGLKSFGILGAGIIKIENEDTGYEESKLGFNAGLGFGIGLAPMFDVELRGTVLIAPQEEGSKKALLVTAGVNYYFGVGM